MKNIKTYCAAFGCILSFMVLQPSVCGATTYYVNATDGDDAAPGTSENTPWKTIAKVNNKNLQPGDFVLFKRGETWHEQLTVPSSGTSNNPITFGAYGTGNRPLICGAPTRNYCIYVYEKHYIHIRDIATCNSKNDGINFRGQIGHTTSHCTVINCESYNNSAHGFKVAQWEDQYEVTISAITFIDCIAHDNDYYGFQASNGSGNVTFINCVAYNNDSHGFRFGTTQTGLISRCISYSNGRGLRIDDSNGQNPTNLTIERSSFYNNATGLSVANGSNIVIKANLVFNNAERGLSYGGIGNDSASIYNNTFCNNNTANSSSAFNLFIGSDTDFFELKNNIVYNSINDGPMLYIESSAGTTTLDYNCYYTTSANNFIIWQGASYALNRFAAYQSATGQDAGSKTQNPLFQNLTEGNFTLSPSSPCIDAGTDINLEYDFAGTVIPQGMRTDIGAFESGSEKISPPENLHIIFQDDE